MSASCAQQSTIGLLEGLIELVFPPHCLVCGTMGTDAVCDECLSTLVVPIAPPFCVRCGQVQVGPDCVKCIDYPDGLIRCRSVGVHAGKLAELIHLLKYREKPMLAQPLSRLIVAFLELRAEVLNDLRFDAIVPVPLFKSRERKRGYNQSHRLAVGVGTALGIPVERSAVSRIRDTHQQVGMARAGRLANLKNAFLANPRCCKQKTFLLLDDVTTTGSTMRECASALLSAGAATVYGIALAAG